MCVKLTSKKNPSRVETNKKTDLINNVTIFVDSWCYGLTRISHEKFVLVLKTKKKLHKIEKTGLSPDIPWTF